MALGFGRPPPDITHQRLFDQMRLKIQQLRTTLPDPNYPGKPLLSVKLTEDQWSKLYLLLGELTKDYKLRREMLLTRLDVTVLSFTVINFIQTLSSSGVFFLSLNVVYKLYF